LAARRSVLHTGCVVARRFEISFRPAKISCRLTAPALHNARNFTAAIKFAREMLKFLARKSRVERKTLLLYKISSIKR